MSTETADTRPHHLLSQLGMRDVVVEGADLAMDLPLAPHLTNARGGLQGGLIATLIDIVAGRVALEGLPSLQSIATSDLTVHYLAPVVVGPARAAARVLRRGSRSVVLHVEVHDVGTGKLAAVSTIAFAVLKPR
ncbi:MAG: phenylacetic acid degradation-like protein [Frankiales bacterium]|nr:phenylacetic acid degradation-like protein [Frankiales bacterium]